MCLVLGAACGDEGGLASEDNPSSAPDCPCRLATQFDNLALCVSPSTAFAPSHVFSSSWDTTTKTFSCEPWRDPQPAPAAPWTSVKVSSACQGTAEVCVSIRAGDVKALSSADCTLATRCSSVAYTTQNQVLDVLPLAGWTAESSACAVRHEQLGAYMEFTVQSTTLGCGMGTDTTTRVGVCPARCQTNPMGAGCEVCGKGAVPINF
ncbi:MAG: hypothetical protein RLZZ450_6473 [Pseudomonadota bacterium]